MVGPGHDANHAANCTGCDQGLELTSSRGNVDLCIDNDWSENQALFRIIYMKISGKLALFSTRYICEMKARQGDRTRHDSSQNKTRRDKTRGDNTD
jgi:hypothetical protein